MIAKEKLYNLYITQKLSPRKISQMTENMKNLARLSNV